MAKTVMRASASAQQRFSPHRLIRLRERHFFTRNHKLRLRYVTTCLACLTVGTLSIFGQSASSWAIRHTADAVSLSEAKIETTNRIVADILKQPARPLNAHLPEEIKTQLSSMMRAAPTMLKKADTLPFRRVSIQKGDTIAGALQEAGVSGTDAFRTVEAMSEHFNPRHVKSGQTLGIHFRHDNNGDMDFQKLSMKLSPVKELVVQKDGDESFTAELQEKELVRKTQARYAEIQTSLYGSAARADIPSLVIAEIIRAYSWDIDFQRDIRRGDKIQVLYETFETEDGDFAKFGDVLFASLSVRGKEIPIYRYEMANGRIDYFEADGTSIRKTLMKTPVDGARISSNYGMRRHPILGYNKMHKGMDFAAPTGTPIYAAGDGTVEYVGRRGAYGKYVRIRHNGKLKTAYAHLHKYKKGLKKGKQVEQGDIIGYVGSTGRSTGPHLHYEVLVHGKQVNPRSVDLPTGETLSGKELARFEEYIESLNNQYVSLSRGLKYAFSGDPDNG